MLLVLGMASGQNLLRYLSQKPGSHPGSFCFLIFIRQLLSTVDFLSPAKFFTLLSHFTSDLHYFSLSACFCFCGKLQGKLLMVFKDTRMIFIFLVVRQILSTANAIMAFPAKIPSVTLSCLHEQTLKPWLLTFHFHGLSHTCPPIL